MIRNWFSVSLQNPFLFLLVFLFISLIIPERPAVADGNETTFEKCGDQFFPFLVEDVDKYNFSYVHGTDLLTSVSPDPQDKGAHLIYTSAGALKIGAGVIDCSLNPNLTREKVVAAWIRQVPKQSKPITKDKKDKIISLCGAVGGNDIKEALETWPTKSSVKDSGQPNPPSQHEP